MSAAAPAPDATTTTAVPRIVGEPLPEGVVLGSGFVLFVVIVVAGLWLRGRKDADTSTHDPWEPGA